MGPKDRRDDAGDNHVPRYGVARILVRGDRVHMRGVVLEYDREFPTILRRLSSYIINTPASCAGRSRDVLYCERVVRWSVGQFNACNHHLSFERSALWHRLRHLRQVATRGRGMGMVRTSHGFAQYDQGVAFSSQRTGECQGWGADGSRAG